MKKLNLTLLILAPLCFSAPVLAKKKKQIEKTAVANCGSGTIECKAVVNAMGDAVMIDLADLSVTDLGTISEEKLVDIALPTEEDTKTAYSFTPTTGESQGTKTLLVFENIKQAPGTRLYGKTFVRISRHFAPVEEGTPWVEVGRIETDELEESTVPITFKPDGSAIWIDPEGEPMVFPIAKKDLGA